MKVFLVTREGVYRHEILGVYSDIKEACARAIECSVHDYDDYHSYEVSTTSLDESVENTIVVHTVTRTDVKEFINKKWTIIKYSIYLDGEFIVEYIGETN